MAIEAIDPRIVRALEGSVKLDELKDNSYRRSLADMLRRNGPLQTLAFLRSKVDPEKPSDAARLLQALRTGLEAIPGHRPVQLDAHGLAALPVGEMLSLAQRLTRVAVWINRLVEARPTGM